MKEVHTFCMPVLTAVPLLLCRNLQALCNLHLQLLLWFPKFCHQPYFDFKVGVPSKHQKKRRKFGGGLRLGVDGEGDFVKNGIPLSLLLCRPYLDRLVHPLAKAVGLRVIGSSRLFLYVVLFAKLLHSLWK